MQTSVQNRTNFDVVIIGGGAAGLSAALWCDELGLSALLLEQNAEPGGQLLWTHNEIKNHLGIEARTGRELRDIFVKQIEKRDFSICLDAPAAAVDAEKMRVSLADGKIFDARAMIAATGIRRRKLNVEGEDEFKERGIIETGKQNAEVAAGKSVLIVGGGDAAAENALILAEPAAEIVLVHRRPEFRARAEFLEPVKNNPKIRILTETSVLKIGSRRGESVEFVELKNLRTGEVNILPVDLVLIRIGVEPNTEIFRGQLELDAHGYIKIDRNCETSRKNIFAIGDVANPLSPTVSSAVGMGATAVKTIYSWLNAQK